MDRKLLIFRTEMGLKNGGLLGSLYPESTSRNILNLLEKLLDYVSHKGKAFQSFLATLLKIYLSVTPRASVICLTRIFFRFMQINF